jgi:hypothetical protein
MSNTFTTQVVNTQPNAASVFVEYDNDDTGKFVAVMVDTFDGGATFGLCTATWDAEYLAFDQAVRALVALGIERQRDAEHVLLVVQANAQD